MKIFNCSEKRKMKIVKFNMHLSSCATNAHNAGGSRNAYIFIKKKKN